MPNLTIPQNGTAIERKNFQLVVPDNPIIPFIEGDGTGPDIWRASVRVLDAAVAKAYGGKKKIAWMEVYAGEKSFKKFNNWLPDETVEAFRTYLVGIKGPLDDAGGRRHPFAQRRACGRCWTFLSVFVPFAGTRVCRRR